MKRLFFSIVLLSPFFLHAQNMNGNKGFLITGTVTGLAEKSDVFLTDANNAADTLARTMVQSGKFILSGHVNEPNLYEINFGAVKKKSVIFIGNDAVTVSGNAEDLKSLSVKGSSSQDDFMDFQNTFNPYILQLNALNQFANSPEGMNKRDSIVNVSKGLITSILSAEDQFIQNKKSSYVSPFVLIVLSQLSDDVIALEKRLSSLSPLVQNSFYGKYLQQQIADKKVGAVGTDEIDFVQNDTTGKPVQLSSFKGKYVLVDFWASWCHPCRMENPNVVAAFNRFKNKNFTVLGVSLDKAREPWLQAIKQDNLTWTHVSDLKFWNNDVAVKYHVQQIPQNMLIGPDGKIIAKNLRGEELQAKLCELLGCN
ncbi:MAG: AhpC/TSA family protein [Bacteroidetes bacterium]|nr:AhpC/TSA family protein [Bacteroidota bacterium]